MYLHITALLSLLLSPLILASPAPLHVDSQPPNHLQSRAFTTFGPKTIFTPPSTYIIPRTLYARSVLLSNGDLLSTWENYSNETLDGVKKHISNVTDTVNGWGLRYQPDLYQLPSAIGRLPKGTLLASGNSIPTDLAYTKIDIYYSLDDGKTWRFLSSVASGGEALPNNGLTPIWEPFLRVYKNQLVCFYSDQRDPAHGQKLVHQVSKDGVKWGPVVDDVSYSTYTARPGMTSVAQLPNGKYILTYEYGGGPLASGSTNYAFPIYYRISDSPLTFNDSIGYPIIAGGLQPTSSPFVVWSPHGGVNGTIVVSAGSLGQIFTNTKLGAVNDWVAVETPQAESYTRALLVLGDDHVGIFGGGVLGGASNVVSNSVVRLA